MMVLGFSDYYSAMLASFGLAKHPTSGGIGKIIREMMESFKTTKEVDDYLDEKFKNKDMLPGFGHRVFKKGDPRHFVLKSLSEKMSLLDPKYKPLHDIACHFENRVFQEKKLISNYLIFSSMVTCALELPEEIAYSTIVAGRSIGFTAHIFEQRKSRQFTKYPATYIGQFQELDLTQKL